MAVKAWERASAIRMPLMVLDEINISTHNREGGWAKNHSKARFISISTDAEQATIETGPAVTKDYGWSCVAGNSNQGGQAHYRQRAPWCVHT